MENQDAVQERVQDTLSELQPVLQVPQTLLLQVRTGPTTIMSS